MMSSIQTGFLAALSLWVLSFSFKKEKSEIGSVKSIHGNYALDSTSSGKQLAQKYCQSCHLFPEAEIHTLT